MQKIDIAIVGAGVVGLATAVEAAQTRKNVFIIERNDSFGREGSSRNSEVIHAGIYYPKDSLKARTCLEGRRLLYDFCAGEGVPFRKTGKLIVGTDREEIPAMEKLFRHGFDNGVNDMILLSRSELKKLEPKVKAEAAIYSPSTGIIDSHAFMKKMAMKFKSLGGQISYNSEVIGIDKAGGGFEVTVRDSGGEAFKFLTAVLINSAGLNSGKIAAIAGAAKDEYGIKYCKGSYFRVSAKKANLITRLVYPLPGQYHAGLGIHATPDLAGGMRLGPDAEYVDELDYNVDDTKRPRFCESVKSFLPFIEPEDLSPDTSGIRPKLQGPGEAFRDFVIKDESDIGLEGLINLVGIESPGLTASLSIAKMVKNLVRA